MIDNLMRVVEFILIYKIVGLMPEISQKPRNHNRIYANPLRVGPNKKSANRALFVWQVGLSPAENFPESVI